MNARAVKWAVGATAVVIAVVAASGAFARPQRPTAELRGAGAFRAGLAKVGLSAEQREKIRGILVAERPRLEALRGERSTSKAALDASLQGPDPDPTAVGSALLRTRADRQALRAERTKVREQTLSVLTPEQRATLAGYLAGARASRRGDRG